MIKIERLLHVLEVNLYIKIAPSGGKPYADKPYADEANCVRNSVR